MRNIDKQSEMSYQRGVKEMILETALGWSTDQITEQLSLQLGSTERLVPDMLVRKDDHNSFIIEVKKPGHKKTKGDIGQLLSYMKQLEIPVGIYWGDEVEVYWKTIGDGSSPVCLLSFNFNVNCEEGDAFVSLFSEGDYNLDKVQAFKNECGVKAIFESKVKDLRLEVLSAEFTSDVKKLIFDYLIDTGKDKDVVEAVMEKVSISISLDNNIDSDREEDVEEKHQIVGRFYGKRSNNGVAQRYAYDLIRQIIEKNRGLSFGQLYGIFKRKNRIEDVTKIKDEARWFLHEDDVIKLSDGTMVAISNQWGFNGFSKPKMDELREIAKRYGIDKPLPY